MKSFLFILLIIAAWGACLANMPKMERMIWTSSVNGDMLTTLLYVEDASFQNSWVSIPRAVAANIAVAMLMPVVYTVNPDILQLPFLEGSVYSVILSMKRNRPKTIAYFDKYNWFLVFNKHGILTPDVYATIHNGVITPVNGRALAPDTKYIFKPRNGAEGKHVSFETLASFQQRRYTGAYLAQQRVYDSENATVAHSFRFVSTSDREKVYGQYLFEQTQTGDAVQSNEHAGATKSQCMQLQCLNVSHQTQCKLDNVMNQLIGLHRHEFPFVPQIGWDIIICSDGGYVLEGNIHVGIVSASVPGYQRVLLENDGVMRDIFDFQ